MSEYWVMRGPVFEMRVEQTIMGTTPRPKKIGTHVSHGESTYQCPREEVNDIHKDAKNALTTEIVQNLTYVDV